MGGLRCYIRTHTSTGTCVTQVKSFPVPLDPLNDGRRDVYVTQRRATHVTLKTLPYTSCTRFCTHSLTNANKKHGLHPEAVANSFKVQPSVSRSKFRERERELSLVNVHFQTFSMCGAKHPKIFEHNFGTQGTHDNLNKILKSKYI